MPRLTRRKLLKTASAIIALPASAMAATIHEVSITGFAYAPVDLTIKVGDSVKWTNRDAAPHTATARNGDWDTGKLRRNKSSTLVFAQKGEYDYYCIYHPSMRGKLTVS